MSCAARRTPSRNGPPVCSKAPSRRSASTRTCRLFNRSPRTSPGIHKQSNWHSINPSRRLISARIWASSTIKLFFHANWFAKKIYSIKKQGIYLIGLNISNKCYVKDIFLCIQSSDSLCWAKHGRKCWRVAIQTWRPYRHIRVQQERACRCDHWESKQSASTRRVGQNWNTQRKNNRFWSVNCYVIIDTK